MEKLNIITTDTAVSDLCVYLESKDFVSYDIETTGVDNSAQIIGLSVGAATEEAFYVVLKQWDVTIQRLLSTEISIGSVLRLLFLLKDKKLVMHNGVFDCAHTERVFDVSLIDSLHTDTMTLAHLLDENRSCGLKDLSVSIFGEDSKAEQAEMKASVSANGGELTKANYELYKANWQLIAKYGAKDALLTYKLFFHLIPELYRQELDEFFYTETMPLCKGPTYQLNTAGLKVDIIALQKLKSELETESLEAEAFIKAEIAAHVKDKYPGTKKTNYFNISSSKQLSWLLFDKLANSFNTLTKEGRNLCKALGMPLPYTNAAKRNFITAVQAAKGSVYQPATFNAKTKKMMRPKKIAEPWNYLACGKETLDKFKDKYRWVKKFLEYSKAQKLLNTYAIGIQTRMQYGIIRPNFLQIGTTSGRYSSKNPNFQNLPRDDKRVKTCIIARPGKVFVGADFSQLEPRVFASFSKDERLLKCFDSGEDFYSVIGAEAFEKYDCSFVKDEENSFAKLYPELRQIAKVIALSATYGTTAPKMSLSIRKTIDEAQQIIDSYFEKFPSVLKLMLDAHEEAKTTGQVKNYFGRPRRMPDALKIKSIYGNTSHNSLPYEARNMLNLAVNHTIQSTAASIVNRASIAFVERTKTIDKCSLVMNIHDELIAECLEKDAERVSTILKDTMENTVSLAGVRLVAEPKIGKTLSDLKG